MDRRDPDSRPTATNAENAPSQGAAQKTAPGPEAGFARAGSLMSVQIRRTRPPRKRAPGDPATEPATQTAATIKEPSDAATTDSPSHAPEPDSVAVAPARARKCFEQCRTGLRALP